MHGGTEQTLNETDGLVTLLLVSVPDRRKNQDIGVIENPRSESEGKAMLVPVRLVFGLIEFDVHHYM
jgi:hypothetical protein